MFTAPLQIKVEENLFVNEEKESLTMEKTKETKNNITENKESFLKRIYSSELTPEDKELFQKLQLEVSQKCLDRITVSVIQKNDLFVQDMVKSFLETFTEQNYKARVLISQLQKTYEKWVIENKVAIDYKLSLKTFIPSKFSYISYRKFNDGDSFVGIDWKHNYKPVKQSKTKKRKKEQSLKEDSLN